MNPYVYISGATGYAGSIISNHLAEQGHNLILSARESNRLDSQVLELKTKFTGIHVSSLTFDLSDPESWYVTDDVLSKYSIIGYVNCAGIQGQLGPSSSITHEETLRVFNVNLFSSIYLSNLIARSSKNSDGVSIIHFSGGGSTSPRPMFMPYSLSKTALVRFIENFALENSKSNIRINGISPGVMPSRMQAEVLNNPTLQKTEDYKLAQSSLASENRDNSRLLHLCDFLLSDNSKFINGKLISARWDNWQEWHGHQEELMNTDLYTLRRITARDRGQDWGDL